jgi:hypothetical protein
LRLSSIAGVLCFSLEPEIIHIISNHKIPNLKCAISLLKPYCRIYKTFGEHKFLSSSEIEMALRLSMISRLSSSPEYTFLQTEDSQSLLILTNILTLATTSTTQVEAVLFSQHVYPDHRILWTVRSQVFNLKPISLQNVFVDPTAENRFEKNGSLYYFGLKEENTAFCLPHFTICNIVCVHKPIDQPNILNSTQIRDYWHSTYGLSLPKLSKMEGFAEVTFPHSDIPAIYPLCCLFEFKPFVNGPKSNKYGPKIFDNFVKVIENLNGAIFLIDRSSAPLPTGQISLSSSFKKASYLQPDQGILNIEAKREKPRKIIEPREKPDENISSIVKGIEMTKPVDPQKIYKPKFHKRSLQSTQMNSLNQPAKTTFKKIHDNGISGPLLKKRQRLPDNSDPIESEPPKKQKSNKLNEDNIESLKNISSSSTKERKEKLSDTNLDMSVKLKQKGKQKVQKANVIETETENLSLPRVEAVSQEKVKSKTKSSGPKIVQPSIEAVEITLEEIKNNSIQKRKLPELKAFCKANKIKPGRNKATAINAITEYLQQKNQK